MATETLQYLDPDGLDETVLNIKQIAESLESEMQDLPYARPDGIYPEMTVGAVIGADETSQWATRESTGTGSATVRSVQGSAVVWNQLNQNNGVSNTTGLTRTFNSDGSITIDGTSNATGEFVIGDSVQVYKDHKYLVKGCPAGGSSATYYIGISVFVVDTGAGGIWTAGSNAASHFKFVVKSEQTFDNVTFYPQLFDLTAMFGSGNEPTTVAEFERMYPEAYYPYSAPTLKPVQIAGIQSKDAQGGELDCVEWTAQELWSAGTAGDMLYADRKVTNMSTLDMGTLAWQKHATKAGVFYASMAGTGGKGVSDTADKPNCRCIPYTAASYNGVMGSSQYDNVYTYASSTNYLYLKDTSKDSMTAAEFKESLSGVTLVYELATPTTQPISPALPMTYKVQAGGSESIIVPDGEISAAPIITIAEPVNMSTELALIWAAIQSLGYTRNAAQLSRPVSLTDAVGIDETQKDTADVAEIDTIKEVQE